MWKMVNLSLLINTKNNGFSEYHCDFIVFNFGYNLYWLRELMFFNFTAFLFAFFVNKNF